MTATEERCRITGREHIFVFYGCEFCYCGARRPPEVTGTTMQMTRTEIADTIVEAWNTPPWDCNLNQVQQRLMARIAAAVVKGRS